MNWFKKLFTKKSNGIQPNELRIEVIYGKYFPQKKIKGKWTNILCTNDLGWYKVPLFSGYSDRRNAEINIEYAKKYTREAVEYYQ